MRESPPIYIDPRSILDPPRVLDPADPILPRTDPQDPSRDLHMTSSHATGFSVTWGPHVRASGHSG